MDIAGDGTTTPDPVLVKEYEEFRAAVENGTIEQFDLVQSMRFMGYTPDTVRH